VWLVPCLLASKRTCHVPAHLSHAFFKTWIVWSQTSGEPTFIRRIHVGVLNPVRTLHNRRGSAHVSSVNVPLHRSALFSEPQLVADPHYHFDCRNLYLAAIKTRWGYPEQSASISSIDFRYTTAVVSLTFLHRRWYVS